MLFLRAPFCIGAMFFSMQVFSHPNFSSDQLIALKEELVSLAESSESSEGSAVEIDVDSELLSEQVAYLDPDFLSQCLNILVGNVFGTAVVLLCAAKIMIFLDARQRVSERNGYKRLGDLVTKDPV